MHDINLLHTLDTYEYDILKNIVLSSLLFNTAATLRRSVYLGTNVKIAVDIGGISMLLGIYFAFVELLVLNALLSMKTSISEPMTSVVKFALTVSFDGFKTTKYPGFPDLILKKKNYLINFV